MESHNQRAKQETMFYRAQHAFNPTSSNVHAIPVTQYLNNDYIIGQ